MKVDKAKILSQETISLTDLGRAKIGALLEPDGKHVKPSQVCNEMELLEISARAYAVSEADAVEYRALNAICKQIPYLLQWGNVQTLCFGDLIRIVSENLRLAIVSELLKNAKSATPLIVTERNYQSLKKKAKEKVGSRQLRWNALLLYGLNFYLKKRSVQNTPAGTALANAIGEEKLTAEQLRLTEAFLNGLPVCGGSGEEAVDFIDGFLESPTSLLKSLAKYRDSGEVPNDMATPFLSRAFPDLYRALADEVRPTWEARKKEAKADCGDVSYYLTWADLATAGLYDFKNRTDKPTNADIADCVEDDGTEEGYMNRERATNAGIAVMIGKHSTASPEPDWTLSSSEMDVDSVATMEGTLRTLGTDLQARYRNTKAVDTLFEVLADVFKVDELKAFVGAEKRTEPLRDQLEMLNSCISSILNGSEAEKARKQTLFTNLFDADQLLREATLNQKAVSEYKTLIRKRRKNYDIDVELEDLTEAVQSFTIAEAQK